MENNEQEMETPQTEEGEETPEVPAEKTKENQDELLKKFQSAEAQKEHWREKAEKAEAELKKLRPEEQPKIEEPKIAKETNPKLMLRLSKALADYTEDEIDFIYQVSKDDSPETVIETSKSDWVQLAINAKREKVAKEKQIPEPGNVPGGKSTKGLSVEDIDKDPDSHKEAFEEFRKTGKIPGEGI